MLIKETNLYNAAIAHYQAQRLEALSSLEIFFSNPVAVADHSNFLDEIKKWTTTLAEAEENIHVLKKNFS